MVSFVNPYWGSIGPSGLTATGFYAQISNQSGDVAANGAFEPTMATVDYAGPTGATTENSNKITVQAGYDGDYIGIAHLTNLIPNTGSHSIIARFRNSGATIIEDGGKSERDIVGSTTYGRSLISYNCYGLVDGDYLEAEAFQTNSTGTEYYRNDTSISLIQPGDVLATIRLSANQTSVSDGNTIVYNELVNGYADASDLSGGSITINADGWYLVFGQTTSTSSGNICGMTVSGSTSGEIVSCAEYSDVGGGNKGQGCVALEYLTGGEAVSVTAKLNSTVDLVADQSFLSIWRIRTADVMAVLGRASDYSVPNSVSSYQNIPMDSVIEGSGALVTANSGALTIQATGWYLPIFSTDMSRASASECFASPAVRNTTTGEIGPSWAYEIDQAAGTAYARSGMKPMYCTAGDVLELSIYTISGQPAITLKSSQNTRLALIKLTASS